MGHRPKRPDRLEVLEEGAPAPACFPSQSRREAVRRIGGWLIFAGVLGAGGAASEGCGPQPSFNRGGTHGSATCDCGVATGTDTGLKRSDLPLNAVAWNPQEAIFICHDTGGFYALDSLCTHAGCDMGAQGGFHGNNLGAGFFCGCHGSSFDANGKVVGGPAPSSLPHYHLGIDASDEIWIDPTTTLTDSTCRCG